MGAKNTALTTGPLLVVHYQRPPESNKSQSCRMRFFLSAQGMAHENVKPKETGTNECIVPNSETNKTADCPDTTELSAKDSK